MFEKLQSELFGAAILDGMAASPFTSTPESPLILVRGSEQILLVGCAVHAYDNQAAVEEFGSDYQWMIRAQIPKTLLPRCPRVEVDGYIYGGRKYTINSACSDPNMPVWVTQGTSPLRDKS